MFDVSDTNFADVVANKFDLLVCASGYEARARYISKQMLKAQRGFPEKRIVLKFQDHSGEPQRKLNDRFFADQRFEPYYYDDSRYGEFFQLLAERTKSAAERIRLLVDYTSMRRTQYAEIIHFLRNVASEKLVEATFVYAVGKHGKTVDPKIISDYTLMPGFEGLTNSQRDKFAIYNLGFEPIILHSLHEWLEPARAVAIYAEPGVHKGSGQKCLRINRKFLEQVDCKVVGTSLYSVHNYVRLFKEIAKVEAVDNDLVFVSAGPKPFTLGSMLGCSEIVSASMVYAHGISREPKSIEPFGQVVATNVKRVIDD